MINASDSRNISRFTWQNQALPKPVNFTSVFDIGSLVIQTHVEFAFFLVRMEFITPKCSTTLDAWKKARDAQIPNFWYMYRYYIFSTDLYQVRSDTGHWSDTFRETCEILQCFKFPGVNILKLCTFLHFKSPIL